MIFHGALIGEDVTRSEWVPIGSSFIIQWPWWTLRTCPGITDNGVMQPVVRVMGHATLTGVHTYFRHNLDALTPESLPGVISAF